MWPGTAGFGLGGGCNPRYDFVVFRRNSQHGRDNLPIADTISHYARFVGAFTPILGVIKKRLHYWGS